MAVRYRALEFLSVVAVNREHGALEPVADVAEIREPPQVTRDRVEVDEESGEENDGNGGDRAQVDARLDLHGGADQQAQRLRYQRGQDVDGGEHEYAVRLHRLPGHEVHYDHIHAAKYNLKYMCRVKLSL